MAGKPISALALLGLGFRSISMSGGSIGPIKAMILETDIGALSQRLLSEIDRPYGGQTIREVLADHAAANAIPF